jgi:hypothetical protein
MTPEQEREMRGPNLQELVRWYGRYDRITAEGWADYDHALAWWRLRIAAGDFWRPPYRNVKRELNHDQQAARR